MGLSFDVRFANVVMFLTHPAKSSTPRLNASELLDFLSTLQGGAPALVSNDLEWRETISSVAQDAARRLRNRSLGEEDELGASEVRDRLRDLGKALRTFDFYAMPVGDRRTRDEMESLARLVAVSSGRRSLVLLPEYPEEGNADIEIRDPSTPLKELSDTPEAWPGFLFWLRTGESTFIPLTESPSFFARLQNAAGEGTGALRLVMKRYSSEHRTVHQNRLLHLSDLHFGTREALRKQTLLLNRIYEIEGEFDRVVITGDLFENSREDAFLIFSAFHLALRNIVANDPIVVLGNHDQRKFGNAVGPIWRDDSALVGLSLPPVVVDDERRTVFFCFNSSAEGDWARGRIPDEQYRVVATEYDVRRRRHPTIAKYSNVAVVHHHPYPYLPSEERPIPRKIRIPFRGHETFIRMEKADQFLTWCAQRNVPLILHGHKHMPRHRSELLYVEGGTREVTAIGCGSSLGMGGTPLTYNLVSWVPGASNWSVRYFSDPGDGSGFREDLMLLKPLHAA